MRIVCMTNDAQLPMMKNMLNSALKAGFQMNLFHCYLLQTQPDAASYNTAEFNVITLKKLEVIKMNMLQDKEVLWIDNDIVFFQNVINEMRLCMGQFVMQDDGWSPCTGFFLARSGIFANKAIDGSIQWLKQNTDKTKNDQHAFDYVNKRTIGLIVHKLPQDEYPNGDVYFNQNRKSKAKMVHCNYLTTTTEKVERFKEHTMWDESNVAFLLINRYLI